jgi:GntR family transcriptional regulator
VPIKTQSFAREPLYEQVCALLQQQIASGKWKPRAPLPNELDLARELGVSAGTVRKALDKLGADRIVVRRQGRGTFVVDQAHPKEALRFERLRQGNGDPIEWRAELLQQGSGNASTVEQQWLRIGAGEPVVRTRRLWCTQKRPLMVEDTCLATSRLPGLNPDEAGELSITALAQGYGVLLARASERVSAEVTSQEAARLLRIKPDTVLLRCDRIIRSTNDEPIEWRSAHCHMQGEYYLAKVA